MSGFDEGRFKFESTQDDGQISFIEEPLEARVFHDLAKEGGYLSYIFGTVAVLLDHPAFLAKVAGSIPGMFLENYLTTLPMKKGLSSSAAICVLTAKAFNVHYSLGLDQSQIMEIAYQGEMLTPSHCGRMDQCVVMGAGAMAIMEFENELCSMHLLTSKVALHFVVVDLHAGKDTVRILHDLNACFPIAGNPTQQLMHQYLHDIEGIALRAKDAIIAGQVEDLADAMNAAQHSFDTCAMPNCPSQLTSPRLHELMQDEFIRRHSLAVKGVGSQGDGSAQVLCRTAEQQEQVLNAYSLPVQCLFLQCVCRY